MCAQLPARRPVHYPAHNIAISVLLARKTSLSTCWTRRSHAGPSHLHLCCDCCAKSCECRSCSGGVTTRWKLEADPVASASSMKRQRSSSSESEGPASLPLSPPDSPLSQASSVSGSSALSDDDRDELSRQLKALSKKWQSQHSLVRLSRTDIVGLVAALPSILCTLDLVIDWHLPLEEATQGLECSR
jgi:hypothetical protein